MRWTQRGALGKALEEFNWNAFAVSAQTVKCTPTKQVLRGQFAGRSIYAKRYLHSAVVGRSWKHWLVQSHARREWQNAVRLEALGVPIVRYIALGERWSWRGLQESVVLTEAFHGSPLGNAGVYSASACREFVEATQRCGAWQQDLHPNNLLCGEGGQAFCWVDVDGFRFASSVPLKVRRENLARLSTWLDTEFDSDDDAEIRERGRAMRRDLLARRSRRALKRNREFGPHTVGSLRWQVRQPDLAPALSAAMNDPDAFLAQESRLKSGRSATVAADEHWVLKRYNPRKWYAPLRDWVRGSPAHRALRKAYHLELTGISSARAVAAASRALGASYLIARRVEGEVLRSAPWNRTTIDELGRLMAKLHTEGFIHRDLKLSNLIVQRSGSICIVDLDGLRFVDVVAHSFALRDLKRIERDADLLGRLTLRLRLRVLVSYGRARGIAVRELIAGAAG